MNQIMHRNPALQRQFRDVDSGLSYGRPQGMVQDPIQVYLILSVTAAFRTHRSPARSATPPAGPAPNQDHIPGCTGTGTYANGLRSPRSAPTLTSQNRLNVRSGSTAGPAPVQAGAGGVGHMSVQIARLAGARVATTVTPGPKTELAAPLVRLNSRVITRCITRSGLLDHKRPGQSVRLAHIPGGALFS